MPKFKISRDEIVCAALELVREGGEERLNARNVAQVLDCSTQPVMYQFGTIEELKRAVYERAEDFHTEYLLRSTDVEPKLSVGLNYIRFAGDEPNLFRFLFQSGLARERSVEDMAKSDKLAPVMEAMFSGLAAGENSLTEERIGEVFLQLAMFVHGYASLIANNSLGYDENVVKAHLVRSYRGAVYAAGAESGVGE